MREQAEHSLALHHIAPHEPEAVHPCSYRGPTAGRFAAVAPARLAARCYYDACWIAEICRNSWLSAVVAAMRHRLELADLLRTRLSAVRASCWDC
jgi:hypothetical protein